MSLLGIVNVGTQLGEQAGWAGVLALLATVNIFLGLINLAPILPFDGGHIAVATYERVREGRSGRRHMIDIARLMPITYAVVLFLIFFGVGAIYLDIANPINF